MAACNTEGVLLRAEEPKVIKIPNFSKLHGGYIEGGLYLQDAALKTILVRVYPCGFKSSETKDYVSVVFRKQWIRHFPLNFNCIVSVVDIYGKPKYSQTYGMEGLENDFEIDQFVKRSTLFEYDFELLPNDTLTVLCEVSYTMSSSPKSSKIWSILSRLYAWNPSKKEDFIKTQETEEMCSLVVETMDGGEFLLPTPSSYFKVETNDVEYSDEKFCESIQENGNSKISMSSSLGRFVKDARIEPQATTSTCSSNNSSQTEPFEKNSTISDTKDLSNLISNFSAASEKKDISGFISAVTSVLSSKNLLSEKDSEKAIKKQPIPSNTNNSKVGTYSPFTAKTLLEMDCKKKTPYEVQNPGRVVLSKEEIPDIKKSISNIQAKVKRIKPKPKATVASNSKILDLGSRKTVQGSGVCDASPVFNRMLKTPMLENSTRRVKLSNIDADTFDNFLCYLETHNIIAETFEKLCDLYEMADQYEVMDLMGDCTQRLFQSIDVHNFLVVLELADMHSDDKLKRKVLKFFLQNEMDILFSLQNDPTFLEWYGSWKKEDISSNIETSDDEVEIYDNDLNFYR